MLNVSSTGCNNKWQSFAKYPIAKYPIAQSTSWPICFQQVCRTSFQVFNVSNVTTANKLLRVFPRSNSPPGLSLGYLADNFLVPQILTHEDVCCERWAGAPSCWKVKLISDNFWMSHRILITAEYLKAHFFLSSYLSVSYKCYRHYFMQIFVKSVERLNNPVYSAPSCTSHLHVAPDR